MNSTVFSRAAARPRAVRRAVFADMPVSYLPVVRRHSLYAHLPAQNGVEPNGRVYTMRIQAPAAQVQGLPTFARFGIGSQPAAASTGTSGLLNGGFDIGEQICLVQFRAGATYNANYNLLLNNQYVFEAGIVSPNHIDSTAVNSALNTIFDIRFNTIELVNFDTATSPLFVFQIATGQARLTSIFATST